MFWQLKILAKIVLSRLPIRYGSFKRLGIFRSGRMDEPAYAWSVFRRHCAHAGLTESLAGATVLEFGPGDSLLTALFARALGARRTYLVDAADLAGRDLGPFRAAQDLLRAEGYAPPEIPQDGSMEQVLAELGAIYLPEGVKALAKIPTASVDFVFSQAVLEHVRAAEFDHVLRELRRIMCDGAIASHRVDLRDHLAGALNNLRFSASVWESDFMARSGFYTNRIRFSDMLERMKAAGFAVEVIGVDRWARLPTPRGRLKAPFRDLPDSELCVSGFDVLMRPVRAGAAAA